MESMGEGMLAAPTGPAGEFAATQVAGAVDAGALETEKPPRPEVTQGFCEDMLRGIAEREAPYFVEGKYTGEAREGILRQCSQQVCDWAKKYSDRVGNCGSACPSDCSMPDNFVNWLSEDQFPEVMRNLNLAVTTVNIKLPGAECTGEDCNEAGPAEDPIVTKDDSVVGGAPANDPRDPEYVEAGLVMNKGVHS